MLWRMFSYRMAMSRIRVTVNLPFVTGVSWKSTMAVPMSPCVKCLLQTNNGRSYSWTGRFYCRRFISNKRSSLNSSQTGFAQRNRTTVIYVISLAVAVVGFSYAAVPLYRLYCQATGLGGTAKAVEASDKIEKMERKPERVLKIRFNADTSSSMQWHFKPQQNEVRLVPGETALAFYTATNPTDQAITGISTYNVIPFDAGQYFNKIQCFCFEEQRLNPHEQVDMPVFFYIDPDFTEDPAMAKVDTITLSYTFFEAKEAEKMGI